MGESIRFSVIIPVFNAEEHLAECLNSVREQTFSEWECICVDDGSRDNSRAIIEDFVKRDPRFRLICLENGGVSRARNAGLKCAIGAWITWLDADDAYAPDRLEVIDRIARKESPDLVRFQYSYSATRPTLCPPDNMQPYRVFEGEDARYWGWTVFIHEAMVWMWAARRDLLEGIFFPEGMRIKEDGAFCARIINRFQRVVQSEYSAYFYRANANSAMHRYRSSKDCVRVLEDVGELYQMGVKQKEELGPSVFCAMRMWLRVHAEYDIVDWMLLRDRSVNGNSLIRKAYANLRRIGLCGHFCQIRGRYAIPFIWWNLTGQVWLTDLFQSLFTGIRGALRK